MNTSDLEYCFMSQDNCADLTPCFAIYVSSGLVLGFLIGGGLGLLYKTCYRRCFCQQKTGSVEFTEMTENLLSQSNWHTKPTDEDFDTVKQDLDKTKQLLYQCKTELDKERKEHNALLNKHSAMISLQIRANNPNIVNLNDGNRSSKLGERMSELYDNEWTNAFDAIAADTDQGPSDGDIIQRLLAILQESYTICQDNASKQLQDVETALQQIMNNGNVSSDIIQRAKEERMANANEDCKVIHQITDDILQSQSKSGEETSRPEVAKYVTGCVQLCWFMAIRDPPMVLLSSIDAATNRAMFRGYQNNGPIVSYMVWPALLLHEGGAMVNKGIAEFKE